jgi:S1-C subfamily serine protease
LGSNIIKEVKVGDNVYAIGHPKSLPWSFSAGMVSQIRPNHIWTYEDESEHEATVIQTQAPMSTGNSGGPVFSGAGKVVGVFTLFQPEGQNLNFAIAVDHVKQFIKDNPNVKKVNPIGTAIKKDYPNAKAQDYNKNGVIDTWYVDDDKNGKIDTGFIDDDEDGFIEGTLIDKNENGVFEIMMLDTDKDGKPNEAYLDEDEDKKFDVIAYDYDQDGEWDKFEEIG